MGPFFKDGKVPIAPAFRRLRAPGASLGVSRQPVLSGLGDIVDTETRKFEKERDFMRDLRSYLQIVVC